MEKTLAQMELRLSQRLDSILALLADAQKARPGTDKLSDLLDLIISDANVALHINDDICNGMVEGY